MPLISFPWLFPRELGLIATNGTGPRESMAGEQRPMTTAVSRPHWSDMDRLGVGYFRDSLPEIQPSSSSLLAEGPLNALTVQNRATFCASPDPMHALERTVENAIAPFASSKPADRREREDAEVEEDAEDAEKVGEANQSTIPIIEKSAYDDLEKLLAA